MRLLLLLVVMATTMEATFVPSVVESMSRTRRRRTPTAFEIVWNSVSDTISQPAFAHLPSRSIGTTRIAAMNSPETPSSSLEGVVSELETNCRAVESTLFKTCKVRPALSSSHRLGLVATQSVSKGDVLLSMPYSSAVVLTADRAKATFQDILPDQFNGWTGDAGLMALLLLNELALASDTPGAGVQAPASAKLPPRNAALNSFLQAWLSTLPHVDELTSMHPLFWPEDDQEILQSSSTTKVYRVLDDIEEDFTWMSEYIWKKKNQEGSGDTVIFPDSVTFQGREYPCFSLRGFLWAMALVQSRSFFLDGTLRLLPVLDMVNHEDEASEEIKPASMGPWRNIPGAQLVADRSYEAGDEVFCSYGPKSAIDYLLEHVRDG